MFMYDVDQFATFITGAGIALIIFLAIFALAIIGLAVTVLVGCCKFYTKVGRKWWEYIIPIYGSYVLCEIAGVEWYWVLLLCADTIVDLLSEIVPGVGMLSGITWALTLLGAAGVMYNISKKAHKDKTWFIFSIFFSGICLAALGYSKNFTWDESVPVSKNSFFDKDAVANDNNTNVNQNMGVPVQPVQPVEPVQSIQPENTDDTKKDE